MLQITLTSYRFQYKLKEVSFDASQMPYPKPLNTTQQSEKRQTPVQCLCVLQNL